MTKKRRSVLLLLAVIAMLGGCMGKTPVLEELGEDGTGKLKVMSYSEALFYEEYGNPFHMKYPNIQFEVVSIQEIFQDMSQLSLSYQEAFGRFVEKHKPDFIMCEYGQFEQLIQEDKLYNLDAIIAEETFDLDGYLPGVIDVLRETGGGSVYGLAPTLDTAAVFYNAELFRAHHIEPPRNKMTWQELFELSERFAAIDSGEERLYGLSEQHASPVTLFYEIAETSSLRLIDAKGEKVIFNTEGWKEVLEMVSGAIRSHALHAPTPKPDSDTPVSMLTDSPFFRGKAAMVIGNFFFFTDLRDRPQYDKDAQKIDWGVVTVPVDPQFPDVSPHIRPATIFAIPADSPNKRAAWEFVKHVNDPEKAKKESRTLGRGLPARSEFFTEVDGKNVEALYMLKPKGKWGLWGESARNIPSSFLPSMYDLLEREFMAVADGKKTVEEAAASIEREGNEALKQARKAAEMKREAAKQKSGEDAGSAPQEDQEGAAEGV
ncbi:ABC transporter substrate-binding protein [Paenibacillus dendritiformis]|uniref:ABC transporter substrate-binding protein n=1 Tax=Paenibacillus dendritiformis TaxID=130049 RepID=UPI00387E1347